MPSRAICAFLIIFISIALNSCKEKPTEPHEVSALIPLSDKNTWNYDVTWFNKDGIATRNFTQTMTAAGPDTAGNFIGYELENCPLWIWSMIYSNRSDGLYLTENPAAMPIDPSGHKKETVIEKALNFPTVRGDELLFRGFKIVTKSASEKVSVPAGEFSCIVYEAYYESTLNSEMYFAPDFGLVKLVSYSNTDKKVTVLTSYEIK